MTISSLLGMVNTFLSRGLGASLRTEGALTWTLARLWFAAANPRACLPDADCARRAAARGRPGLPVERLMWFFRGVIVVIIVSFPKGFAEVAQAIATINANTHHAYG